MNLYQPTITGSLSVSGSVNISGSITIAGGGTISGTASIATTALTASSADNFLTRGTLTAQTLVVQTITSSVSTITGSTNFGSLLANTHTFTGSVSMTGSLAVVTTGTEFQVTSTGVRIGNVIGDAHNITGSVGISGSLSGVGANFSNNIIAGGSTDDTSGGLYSNIALNNSTYSRYSLLTGGTARARFQFDGTNTALTTTSTGGKLQLATFGASAMEFFTNDALKMTIASGGAVGIGCTPGSITSLDIQNLSATSNNVFLRLQNNAASEDCGLIISGSYGTAYEHRIGVNTIIASKDLCFTNSSGAGFRWYTNGTQSLNLTSDGVLDLSFGQIKFPATQVASANANTLDDYEEGTFTPDIRNGSWAFGARSGFYTKIGNLVTVNFLIVWTSNNIPSGAAFEITLPFAAFGSGNFRAPATIGYTSGINFNTSRQLVAHVDMSNNYISFQQIVSGATPILLTNADINNSGEIQISVTYQV